MQSVPGAPTASAASSENSRAAPTEAVVFAWQGAAADRGLSGRGHAGSSVPGIRECIDTAAPRVCDAGKSRCRMAADLFGAEGVAAG